MKNYDSMENSNNMNMNQGVASQGDGILNPNLIPKYAQELTILPTFAPKLMKGKKGEYEYIDVDMVEFYQQILPPPYAKTKVWGYGGEVIRQNCENSTYEMCTPGPTFEAKRNMPIIVNWNNKITTSYMFAVDPTICWANPMNLPVGSDWPPFPPGVSMAQYPVPLVVHRHGGEGLSYYDGHPLAWFTASGYKGPTYYSNKYEYLNEEPSQTLWYHDHAYGLTRLNVYSGLSGFYIIRDEKNKLDNICKTPLPKGKYDIALSIQDRSFYKDGSLYYTNVGNVPSLHPYYQPFFLGNVAVVNGKAWPNLNVEKTSYRFRLLNGSNTTLYNLYLSNNEEFTVIASDGGYLKNPVTVNQLTIAPAERYEIIVDFSKYKEGTKIILNSSNTTISEIMQFTVIRSNKKENKIPKVLNYIPTLLPNKERETQVLYVLYNNERQEIMNLLNGQTFLTPPSEYADVSYTYRWDLVNLGPFPHPIHHHLAPFLVIKRQSFNIKEYTNDWIALNGNVEPPFIGPTKSIPIDSYLIGDEYSPQPYEMGWKDTVIAPPGQVTTIYIRYAPTDLKNVTPGVNYYPFDPSVGPGYLWHCHILEHEDNEMMRSLIINNYKQNTM